MMRKSTFFKIRNLILSSFWLFFVILWSIGCTPQQQIDVPVVTDAKTESRLLPTETLELIVSEVTPELTETPSSNTFGSPDVHVTSTPIESQEIDANREREAQLLEKLMTANSTCSLPCWWDIELGDPLTRIGETFKTWDIGPWRVTESEPKYGYFKIGYHEPGYIDPVHIFLQFYPVDENVEYMQISASHESKQFGEEEFSRDWEQYFLPVFLQTYGKPTLVYLVPGSISELSTNYFLRLYYPELGINISYLFRGTTIDDETLEVCFMLKKVTLIELSIYNPEFADYWPIASLSGLGDEYDPLKVENFLDMDLETFYETYRDPNNLDCIQLGR